MFYSFNRAVDWSSISEKMEKKNLQITTLITIINIVIPPI
jgi:hypothetical protein